MKLEELARKSSDAVRVSVSHLDLPPIGEQQRNRSWAGPVLAATAAAAVVVAGLVVVDRFNRGDTGVADEEVLPTPVEVPRLALPSDGGWTVTAAASGVEDSGTNNPVPPTFTYYGSAGSDDPFADGDLLIATYAVPPEVDSALPQGGTEVEVRGTTGVIASGVDAGLPNGAVSLQWSERDSTGHEVAITLVSRRLDGDQLQSIAETLTVDAAAATAALGIDSEFDRLAQMSGTPFDSLRSETERYLIGYERGGSTNFLVLSSGRGDIDREATVLRWWASDVTPVTIGGHPGYLSDPSSDLPGAGRSLIWAPADGIVANLTYFGPDLGLDLVALGESTVELDEPAWQTVLDEHGASSPDAAGADDFDEIYGESTGTSGDIDYGWVLGLQSDQLCFQMATGGSSSGSCQARDGIDPPTGSAITIDNGFGEQLAHVLIVAAPTVDDIVEVEGRYTVERVDADGASWFVAIGDTTIQPSFSVLVDGEVAATLEAAVGGRAELAPAAG